MSGVIDWLKSHAPRASFGPGPDGAPAVFHAGDPAAEHTALRERVALVIDPGWSLILAEGSDAVDYLHRRLSQAIKPLAIGTGAHALLLGGDGRMQADLLVWRAQEGAMLATPAAFAKTTFERLEKYILMDQVTLTRFWQGEALVALAGPLASDLLASLMDPRPEPAKLKPAAWSAWLTVNLAGLPCRVLCDGRYAVPWYYLSVPPMALDAMLNALAGACREADGGLAGRWPTELLRIESGVPLFGRDTDERTIPLEAGLTDAIHFNKGCYPGQEILARINNLGHPARALARLTLEGEHTISDETRILIGGDQAGHVTSSIAWTGLGRTEALGFLKWDAREATEAAICDQDGAAMLKARIRPSRVDAMSQVDDGGGGR
jgi:aminomethyltransferase